MNKEQKEQMIKKQKEIKKESFLVSLYYILSIIFGVISCIWNDEPFFKFTTFFYFLTLMATIVLMDDKKEFDNKYKK